MSLQRPPYFVIRKYSFMLRNYFKTAIRNLWKNKGYSFINIFGLAVGMAVVLLIGLWVEHELSYDSFHAGKKNIAIIMKKTFFNNDKNVQSGIMLPLYDELKANYPEVKHITRLDWGDNHSLIAGEKKLSKEGHYADPDFLKMFSFPLVKGNADKVLNDPYSIVVTESLALALFGKAEPVGKVVKMDNEYNLVVTGVAKDVPRNSTITFDFLVPYELNIATNDFVKKARTEWQNNFLQNFVELNDGVSMGAFSNRIEHIAQQKSNDKKEAALFVHPMERWHLYDDFKDWVNVGGAIEYVRLFSIVGLLVLIIACINFMNLSTARSEKRAREVGIRKAIGSQRKQLIAQFLGESLLTAFIAFVISLIMVKLSLPMLRNVGFEDIRFNLGNFSLLGIALGGCIITGLLAGSYPALYLSGFTPVKVLKGTFRPGKSANLPRKILVVTQFSFSIALIIGTIIVFQQIQHAKNRPLGYNPNNLIAFSLSSDLQKNYKPLKQELLATGYVDAVSKSSSPMTGVYNQWDDFSWAGKDPNSHPLFSAIMVSDDYDKASGIHLKEGRFFSKQFTTDSNAIVLNEAAVKLMGLKNPVGSTIKFGNKDNVTVIGVIENVMMQDPFKPIMPAIMIYRSYFIFQGLIRFKAGTDLRKALAAIQPVVEKYNPAYPFEYRFVDEEFNKKFRNENQVGRLSGIFAVLAVFISCLGLFGLASFMAERRTKEIGVRKVLGASVSQLWILLSKDFLLLVIISCIIASPLAWYFMQGWLTKYDYHIRISPLVFIGASVLAVMITLVTISFQAIKAAMMNPVSSLRSE
jgi:predicted permease